MAQARSPQPSGKGGLVVAGVLVGLLGAFIYMKLSPLRKNDKAAEKR